MHEDVARGERVLAEGERLERLLVAHHARFLGFLERRLGSRSDAEDVLQAAYARAVEKGVPGGEAEAVAAWFYRVLRNALVDGARRRDADRRAVERLTPELDQRAEPELRAAVCACMHDLIPSMRPEYAEIVRAVELEGRPLAEVAADRDITVNNATVRLHRARQALKKQLLRACGACAAHGCLDCGCRTGASRGSPTGG